MSITSSIEKQAAEIADRHFKWSGSKCVRVFGDWGMGKSSLLESLATILNDQNRPAIVVSPPTAELDTGPAALVQIAQGLATHGLMNDSNGVENIRNPRLPFEKKLDVISEILEKEKGNVVLLCDEPSRWAIRERDDILFYADANRHAKAVSRRLVEDFTCSRVIAEQSWDGITQDAFHHLVKPGENQSLLSLPDFQDELDEILKDAPQLRSEKSYLYLRILAALKASGGDPFELMWQREQDLAIHLLRFLKDLQLPDNLLRLVEKLPLVRGPIDDALLTALGFTKSFSSIEERLLKHAILTRLPSGEYSLHSSIRYAIAVSLPIAPEIAVRTHGEIAEFFASRLQVLRAANKIALDVEYRGYDQSARAGFASIERFSHFFTAQLHVWGRTLSRDLHRYRDAAIIFRSAVDEDDRDEYGNHYAAYNLDIIAAEEDEIELRYRRAVELNFSHPWYWSRWINFLVTTGRMQEAYQEWNIALNVLSAPDNEDSSIYEHLHFWVAQLLIYRAQLEFAERVLQDVKPKVRATDVRFVELNRLLTGMKIARDERPIFPAYVDPANYWSKYPHLEQPLHWRDRHLDSFYSARVEHVDDDAVAVIVGRREDGVVRYGAINIPRDKFDSAALDFCAADLGAGRYIELSYYGDDQLMRIDAYPMEPPSSSTLPPLDPPNPNRYLEGWNPRK